MLSCASVVYEDMGDVDTKSIVWIWGHKPYIIPYFIYGVTKKIGNPWIRGITNLILFLW